MVKTLKEKLNRINQAVNLYDEEQFNHLSQFEKKLLKKRAKMLNSRDKSIENRKKANAYNKDQALNYEKHTFYKTKHVLGQTSKNEEVPTSTMYNKGSKKVTASDEDKDKLLKELSYTKQELVQARQRIQQIEEGQLSIDNKQYREKMKKLETELLKEKTELMRRVKEFDQTARQKSEALEKQLEVKKNDISQQQNQYEILVKEYHDKLGAMEQQQREIESRNQSLNEKF